MTGEPDDDELGPVVARNLGKTPAEPSDASPDEAAPWSQPVRLRERGGLIQPQAQNSLTSTSKCASSGSSWSTSRGATRTTRARLSRRETAREVECVLRLLSAEQRHDDAPVADRSRPPGQAARAAPQRLLRSRDASSQQQLIGDASENDVAARTGSQPLDVERLLVVQGAPGSPGSPARHQDEHPLCSGVRGELPEVPQERLPEIAIRSIVDLERRSGAGEAHSRRMSCASSD